jgi:hypothetical protein
LEKLLPCLEVQGPDGQQFRVALEKDRVTIGRFDLYNDIALEPDPQQLISRKVHCAIERGSDGWWVVDNGSINRTFLRRAGEVDIVTGRALLKDGDCILILGKLSESSDPCYWELVFSDPMGTRPAPHIKPAAYLEYDWIGARLFRIDGDGRQEISDLRPQEHKLIRYMDQRNRANGNIPVMCTFEELLFAIWGEETSHTESEINHLIWELRQKIEPNSREPRFLETVRGLGYRLVTRPQRK